MFTIIGRNCPQQCKSCFDGIKDNCQKRTKNRIIGGQDAPKFAFPWIVQVLTPCHKRKQHVTLSCGGSLISKKFVASSYHCFYTYNSVVNVRILPEVFCQRPQLLFLILETFSNKQEVWGEIINTSSIRRKIC